jgi:uncharacterized membrane protein YebE (DUF533 family)
MNFDDIQLGLNHVQVIVRGMYAVAKSDGVHETELVMMQGFYESCRSDDDGLTSFKELIEVPLDLAEAKEALDTDALRQAFLKSCLFLAFADGVYSDGEKKAVRQLAAGVGLSESDVSSLESVVKGELLRQVSRVQNMESLKEVATSLDS